LSVIKHKLTFLLSIGEKVLQSKYYKNGQGVSILLDNNKPKSILPGAESGPASPSTSAAASGSDVNQDHLRQLVDMRFSREHSIYALHRYLSLEGATEYLLTNPRNRASILLDAISDDGRSITDERTQAIRQPSTWISM
jgi:hypothetical protein